MEPDRTEQRPKGEEEEQKNVQKQEAAACCICLQPFDELSERLVAKLVCNCTFHEECVHLWMLRHWSCPICHIKLPRRKTNPIAYRKWLDYEFELYL